jgi:hypothetical protein
MSLVYSILYCLLCFALHWPLTELSDRLTMRQEAITTFLFVCSLLIMSALSLQREQILEKIQAAIQLHKRGEFVEAVALYDQVIPFLEGKTASQIASNSGAIYLHLGLSLYFLVVHFCR